MYERESVCVSERERVCDRKGARGIKSECINDVKERVYVHV